MKEFIKKWVIQQRVWLVFILVLELLLFVFRGVFQTASEELKYFQIILSTIMILFVISKAYNDYHVYQKLKIQLAQNCLPSSNGLEMLYINKIQQLLKEQQLSKEKMRQFQKDQWDYYTLWAHQIKTPIAAAKLLIDNDSIDRPMIHQELFKIQQYVDFVLHYLRVESFHEDLVLQHVSLDKVIRDTIKKFAPIFIQKQIAIDYMGTNQVINSDEKWLAVILEQIVSNALKYTQQGTITIKVNENCLIVEDTGIGIQSSDLERVFERGFTGYNGRINQQSSGLGLYLTRLIASKLGIDVSIQSKVKQGTIVLIEWYHEKIAED